MDKIDATRIDLACEFRDHPSGPHSEELQKLLKILRWDSFDNRIIGVQIERGGRWHLARSNGRKGSPLNLFSGTGYNTAAEIQWAIFRARWKQHTGQDLCLEKDEPLPSEGNPQSNLTSRAVVGYADHFSIEAGKTIAFKVSASNSYNVSFERLICGDAENIGMKTLPIQTSVDGEYVGRHQSVSCGSYVDIERGSEITPESFTYYAFVWPTVPDLARSQVIMGDAQRFMYLNAEDRLSFRNNGTEVSLKIPLLSRHWYFVAASCDTTTGEIWLAQRPLHVYAAKGDSTALAICGYTAQEGQEPIGFRIAAGFGTDGSVSSHYNGKIDSPVVMGRALSNSERAALMSGECIVQQDGAVIASWDFSQEISTTRIVDTSNHEFHGVAVNLPTRAMKGWNWDGSEYNWTHRPSHYGAIHFHDDDLYDCGWKNDFEFEVPKDLRSGLYCARLISEGTEEAIPFVVRPPKGEARASLALLLPTASYWAYGNTHHHLEWTEGENIRNVFTTIDATTLFLHEHPEFGCSLYDHHSDGSGVCYASRLRPILNMRPGERLWQLPADTHIIDWLEEKDIAFDIITEDDLEVEGVSLLNQYRCVMTGTHPEYPSKTMLDSILAYQNNGGRFIYMGGNGFYWRTSYHPELPGVLEMRRAEDGIRTWAAEGGEYYHSFTGELGGMWRRMGQAPQSVAGTGMSAQGFDVSTYFERLPASFDARASFVFQGIGEHDRIGDFGLIGGGAAGWEVDRADARLGTPPHALILATATNFSSGYHWMKEELTHTHSAINGETCPLVRCDMVFYETPKGGAVFSTSSIAWAGALSHADYDNNVSRITENVIRRFIDPMPFE